MSKTILLFWVHPLFCVCATFKFVKKTASGLPVYDDDPEIALIVVVVPPLEQKCLI